MVIRVFSGLRGLSLPNLLLKKKPAVAVKLGHREAGHSSGHDGHGGHDQHIENPYNWRINKASIFQDPWEYGNVEGANFGMYRESTFNEKELKDHAIKAKIIGALFWSYLMYNFYYHYYDIVPFGQRYTMQDFSEWTDEELGIPPDEEGLASVNLNPRRLWSKYMDQNVGDHEEGYFRYLCDNDAGPYKF